MRERPACWLSRRSTNLGLKMLYIIYTLNLVTVFLLQDLCILSSDVCLYPFQWNMLLFVIADWMRLYICKWSTCVLFQRNANLLLLLLFLSYCHAVWGDFCLERLWSNTTSDLLPTLFLLSQAPTPSAAPAPPLALGPRKRFIVQAGSESREVWFWLARCAASETLTFLQGLHLELVSCSGCAEQGRGLAQLCDWPRLRLYGPRDGWNCQTVIRQSLAYRFKPEHNVTENIWLVQSCK